MVLSPAPTRHGSTRRLSIGYAEERLLRALGRYHLLTIRQLTRLLYAPTSEKYALRVLKDLAERGYVTRLILPRRARTGSSPLVYELATMGRDYLRGLGIPLGERYRPSEAQETLLHLEHTLAVNDALICLALLYQATPRLRPGRLLHERDLRRKLRLERGTGRTHAVEPDAWFQHFEPIDEARAYEVCVLLEVDRDTEEQKRWRGKVAMLLELLNGAYQAYFETETLTAIAVTTPNERRRDTLIAWTEAELAVLGKAHHGELFHITSEPADQADPATFFVAPIWRRPFGLPPAPLLEVADG